MVGATWHGVGGERCNFYLFHLQRSHGAMERQLAMRRVHTLMDHSNCSALPPGTEYSKHPLIAVWPRLSGADTQGYTTAIYDDRAQHVARAIVEPMNRC